MLRLARECDFFRKLPPEHREAELADAGPVSAALRALSLVLIAVLSLSETWTFLTPLRRQRFDLDMGENVDSASPRQIRVLLNITVHDFPCVDLSLDYQDVMGTRAVDVRKTIFKHRLHANGTVVGEVVRNNPKAAMKGDPANPSIHRNNTGNKTCGTCYGALEEGECCNTCSEVLYAYRLKRWALPRIEEIEQCKHDGSARSAYQPPQIIRLNDYSSDDYLPKFTKLGSLAPSGSGSSRLATPFTMNLTFEPLKSFNQGRTFQPLVLNFSSSAKSSFFHSDDWGGGYGDSFGDWEDDFLEDLKDTQGSKKEEGKVAKDPVWPGCVQRNSIIHGYDFGAALMVDLTPHGAKAGCWNDDCTQTDKFDCESMDRCADVCQKVAACRWWTWGAEDGVSKCWIRSGRHVRGKRYGFSSGPRVCFPSTNATENQNATANASVVQPGGATALAAEPAAAGASREAEASEVQPRRLQSIEDDILYGLGGSRPGPYSLSFGMPSSHMPVFGMDYSRESEIRRQQRGESCQIVGHFDTNKVPGNFHIGTHGATTPSYLSYFDEPAPPTQNMWHTINHLAFVDVATGAVLNETQPLDGFESPKAFTFQYYLIITPATLGGDQRDGIVPRNSGIDGYQFRAGSFVTNELIGPAIFFRMDIDPIRVTYYTEEVRWSNYLVNLCAVVGGCIAVSSMLGQLMETAMACASNRD